MAEQDYAAQDLKRRPYRTTLVLLSLITVVASTTFLFLFSSAMLDVANTLTSNGIARTLSVFYDTFITGVVLVVILLGVAVIAGSISLELESRRKDIGLMKSIGTLIDTIFDHFMAQAVILLLSGVILGIAVGTLLYFVGLLWLASTIGSAEFTFVFPWIQVAFIAGTLLLAGYFAAQKPIFDAVNESPISSLNPELGIKVRRAGYLDTFGLSFRIATKGAGRRAKGTKRMLLILYLSFTLASSLWVGGGVVEATMDEYIMRSMGENIVAIGNPDLLEQYYSAYSLDGHLLNESFSFLDSGAIISNELVDKVQNLSGVAQVETRLVDYTTFSEGSAVIWNPTLEQYELIGGGRTGSVMVVGIDWENTFSDWYYEGDYIEDEQDAWIGGQLATTKFEDPLVQSLGIKGVSFDVSGIAFDIANGGMVAMISLNRMASVWGVSGGNLLLVQLSRYSDSIISNLETVANEYGFSIYRHQETVENNLQIVAAYWGVMQPITIMALLSAFLSLMYYLLISIFSRFRDFIIMRSIGANPSFIAKTMIAEGIDMGLKAGAPAILTAMIFSIYLLVPEATLPSAAYLPLTFIALITVILIVVTLAAIPVYLLFQSRTDLRVSEFSV